MVPGLVSQSRQGRPVQQFPGPQNPPVVRQLQFPIRVVRRIPTLIAALEAGHVEAGQKLGARRRRDGRKVELWPVAKAPKPDEGPLVSRRD